MAGKKEKAPYVPLPTPPVSALYSSKNVKDAPTEGQYYITTAINYTNGPPHIGHAYEGLLADVIARYHRAYGRDVKFCTGTDEHGQKIAQSAEKEGITPLELCTRYVEKFQSLNTALGISNDIYMRTTDPDHEETCRKLWMRCYEKGDIYLSKYTGWYDVKEESFITDSDAKQADYKDSAGNPLKQVSEECYFFKLSAYREKLLQHINIDNPTFITPDKRKEEVLSMLRDEIPDLCVSRTTFDWGVKLPPTMEDKHVMYVWFDALTNYISAVKLLDEGNDGLKKFWPADVHIVGKDITRFHCIYWPAMLWSAGLELPKCVAGHGFVQDEEGKKMSKSVGNVVCPVDLLTRYQADTIRFYATMEAGYGSDLKASEKKIAEAHNNVLGKSYGNLAQRAVALTHKYYNGQIPAKPEGVSLPMPFDVLALKEAVEEHMKALRTKEAVMEILKATSQVNGWLTEVEPWKMKEDRFEDRKEAIRLCVEATYALAHFFAAFIPTICTAVFNKIQAGVTIADLRPGFDNIKPGTVLPEGDWMEGLAVLFPEVPAPKSLDELAKEKAEEEKKAAKAAKGKDKKDGEKKEKKEEKPKAQHKDPKAAAGAKAKPAKPAAEELPEFDADGWRFAVKSDLDQRFYLVSHNDAQFPDVSGVLTVNADGIFDEAVYAKEGEGSGVIHTADGPRTLVLSRTGGMKYNVKEGKLTFKPHHSSNPAEFKDAPVYDCRVSKAGQVKLARDGDVSVWHRKRQI
eukprot:TRINITY_DN4336_c0_g1_i1.p1 TRINITY_DN4336_c0_g1~~TRINITY_DN4336_c0_g1_i1.p1  ORF type:complete len:760 (+),score=381.14 TRINITY_DN4336_c0_g1_i1:52-2280(+)